jgi:hypothetical protein
VLLKTTSKVLQLVRLPRWIAARASLRYIPTAEVSRSKHK